MDADEDIHEHPHHRLIEEIAERVEQRLVAKFAKWAIGNALAVLLAIIGGVAAFYDLKGDVKKSVDRDIYQDQMIDRIQDDTTARRAQLDAKLDSLGAKIDEINRFLRDHNQATLNGFSRK